MANKLFNYFFIKNQTKKSCITLYGKNREIKITTKKSNQASIVMPQDRQLSFYFQTCMSLASSEYCAARNFSRN